MSAGLPTDDPWGDRQQALPARRVRRAAARRGRSFAWPPGTTFDYSNLGYGILGRVITAVAGEEYGDVVRARLLGPLGMASTGFHEDEVPAERLAHGYVARWATRSSARASDAYGALRLDGRPLLDGPRTSPAGSPGSSTRSRPATTPEERPPAPPGVAARDAAGPPRRSARSWRRMPPTRRRRSLAGGYGYGLCGDVRRGARDHDRPRRRLPGLRVAHGLAPGDGPRDRRRSRTCATRAPRAVADRAARGARGRGRRRRAPARPPVRGDRGAPAGRRWPARAAGTTPWPTRAFAMNMDLDEPRAAPPGGDARPPWSRSGPLEPDPDRPDESWSPAHAAWWLRGPRRLAAGRACSTTPEPRAADPGARRCASSGRRRRRCRPPADGARRPRPALDAPGWPAGLVPPTASPPTTSGARCAPPRRASAPLALGLPVEGDGTTTATWELWPADAADASDAAAARRAGRHAPATLVVEAADDGSIRKAELLVAGARGARRAVVTG